MPNIETKTLDLAISADELKASLEAKDKPIVFDLGSRRRYEARHIPGSACAVCDENSKKNIMPRLPKDKEIVLINDNEDYPKHMASMMNEMGLKARYLQGGLGSWKWGFANATDKDIIPNDLKKLLDTNSDLFLLDVREPDEFADWNIEGSHNIPLGMISNSLDRIPHDKKIVTICPHGNRSKIAKFIMQSYGYDVQSLEGGLKAWTTATEHTVTDHEISGKKVKVILIKRIGKGCASYIVSSDGEGAVIDAVFPIDSYLDLAAQYNIRITKVLDTHQHADHVSASKQLADKVGASLYLSSYEEYSFDHNPIQDGDVLNIGNVNMQVIHTPGHTMGSISLLLGGTLLFSGDTLFINGIGRPDLRDKASDFAAALYDSLHKILKMDENTIVYPAHFENNIKIGESILATLGTIKISIGSLLFTDKVRFIDRITANTAPTPKSYKEIISINKNNNTELSSVNEIHELEIGPNRCNIS